MTKEGARGVSTGLSARLCASLQKSVVMDDIPFGHPDGTSERKASRPVVFAGRERPIKLADEGEGFGPRL
jgi:hypothetical protein